MLPTSNEYGDRTAHCMRCQHEWPAYSDGAANNPCPRCGWTHGEPVLQGADSAPTVTISASLANSLAAFVLAVGDEGPYFGSEGYEDVREWVETITGRIVGAEADFPDLAITTWSPVLAAPAMSGDDRVIVMLECLVKQPGKWPEEFRSTCEVSGSVFGRAVSAPGSERSIVMTQMRELRWKALIEHGYKGPTIENERWGYFSPTDPLAKQIPRPLDW